MRRARNTGRLLLCALLCVAGAVHAKAPARAAAAPIAVVQTVTACAPAERAYAAALAEKTRRALAEGGVKADLVDDRALAATLAKRRLAYLVTCSKPTAAQLQALAQFRARGGRIAALQCLAPDLAARLGAPVAPGVATDVGPVRTLRLKNVWWMPNFFRATEAEDAKARLLLGIAAAAVPGAWDAAAWDARRARRLAAERDYGRRQKPRAGEIHAVWDHTGQGLFPGDWPRTMRLLRANGVTDLFVNVAGAGFAHYPSRILPPSPLVHSAGDQLAACLAAARGTGVRVHAWVLCFNATRGSKARLASLAKRGWRVKDAAGRLTEYLDPSNADARWHLISAIDELARAYPVAGVHLDFARWYEKAAGRRAAAPVTQFVEAVRRRLRAARPRMWLTAAVLPSYPACAASVGQDWGAWLDRDLVDYAVPMNYFEDRAAFSSALARQAVTPARARRILAGIGVTANESRLTPAQVIDQVNLARRAGLPGVALFDLDATLADRVLPILRLGLFREPASRQPATNSR